MTPGTLEYEFTFLRDKLEKIATCIAREEYMSAAFMIGCLHNVCHENITKFRTENGSK